MLVGHSYGGAVITVAAALAGNVVGLVYVTAFALDEGESILDVSARFPDSLLTAALRPAVCPDGDGESIVELYIDRDAFPRVFAADLPATVAAVAAAAPAPDRLGGARGASIGGRVEDASVLVRGGDRRPGHSLPTRSGSWPLAQPPRHWRSTPRTPSRPPSRHSSPIRSTRPRWPPAERARFASNDNARHRAHRK